MMASNPQFQLDDQTDEDFFDKLVDDSYSPSEAQASSSAAKQLKFDDDGSDSDDAAKAFANLSLVDDDEAAAEEVGNDVVKEEKEEPSSSIQSDDAEKLSNDAVRSEVDAVPISETVKESDGSGSPGVKEVDWGSFYADSSVNGFGSYSDFFTELEGSAGTLQGKAEVDVGNTGNLVYNDTKNIGFGLGGDSAAGFQQHQGEVNHDSTSGQYVDNSQSWENQYPGWKYDANTGQWYQVDGHDASMGSQESYGNSTSNWEGVSSTADTDVAYLRQSTASAVAGTAENVSTWNQVSHVSNGYPEHMVFDAQYPGWYYDTIVQEWRSLDSYNQASQTTGTGQAHDQQVQNHHALTTMYPTSSEGSMYNVKEKPETFKVQEIGVHSQQGSWDQSYYANSQQPINTWQLENGGKAEAAVTSSASSNFGGNQQVNNLYSTGPVAEQFKPNEIGVQSFVPQHANVASVTQNGPLSFSNDFYNIQQSVDYNAQQSYQSNQLFSPSAGRSPDGRPPHALVNFGFGGKLIVMKDSNGSLQNSSFGSQGSGRSSISVLNLAEVFSGSASNSSLGEDSSCYFRCLHQQSLPGPLVGGNVGSKELNKWLDEKILHCESSHMDFSRGKLLKMLLSLLRISCQFYGKLRSPFGADATQKETDSAEAAVAQLFALAKKDAVHNAGYAPFSQCLQQLPPESQMQVTASEVQNFLASGRKLEALQCAQEGLLWGLALVIAAQLGDQFYVDTVKQMALRQLVPGSPLRTLCLLVAGQPAEVFSTGSTSDMNFPGSKSMPQHQPQQFGNSSMLDNWEENLGIITANRTTDDELVITHLGDCMWKERGEIIAAHICYLIADQKFDPYSDSARLCLVGADHWKYPRTYASPDAIQRTEIYEYSKTLGNSQYIMLSFQPYKVIYAHMLVEVGKLSAAQKYCQAVLKCLKTGRSPEVETWKQIVTLLEDRIRIHQQGGYTVNLGSTKLVGLLRNLAKGVVGGIPPPAPHPTTGTLQVNAYHQQQEAVKLPYSQSANTMQSLVPTASMETIHEWGGNGKTMAAHSRSVSEPDFGRTPIQAQPDSSKKDKATDKVTQVKSAGNVTSSRFSRFGMGILRNTVGRVLPSRSSKEAKLGEENQFYYDENLKRWVEKGVAPPAEEAALPPPPTTLGTYQKNSSGFENKPDMKNEMSPSGGSWSSGSPTPSENSSGVPPISQGSNQFSARRRTGPRARYVDTFNQGPSNSQTMFYSPPAQTAKPPIPAKANFFIPAAPASSSNDQIAAAETRQEEYSAEEVAISSEASPPPSQSSFQSRTPSPVTMQRFPSLDNIKRSGSGISLNGGLPHSDSRRTASWSGSLNSSFTSPTGPSPFKPSPLNSSSGGLGEELQEVEL